MRRGAWIVLLSLLAGHAVRAQPLLLEIWINGHNTHVVAQVLDRNGKLELRNADLADAGLVVARSGKQLLDAQSDIRAEEDAADQRLLLTAPVARLSRTVLNLRPSIVEDVTPASRGATLGYNVSAAMNNVARAATASIGGALALTLFAGNARFTATGFATTGLLTRSARLDTALEFDTPSAPRRIVIGDAITGVPQWERSVRYGGIQIATDFSQQPGRVTFPLPQFFGLAAVPSTVDVFVGASHVFSGAINEGPFALNDLPVMTGGGSATVVVRDVLGRQTSQTISLYTDPALLESGLSSYSLDAGFLRRDYGLSSADYATPFGSALWRRGFEDVTAELNGEFAESLMSLSAGAATTIGNFGLLAVDAAASRHNGQKGAMVSANFTARTGFLSFFGNVAATAGRFSDLASLSGDAFPHFHYETGASMGLGRGGAFSLSWIGQQAPDATRSDLVTASYSRTFDDGILLGLTGFRNFADGSWASELFISMALDGAIASASASAGTGKGSFQATYGTPVDPDGGFGYRLLAGSGPAQHAEADANWIADHGELDASAAIANGHAAMRLGASGGLAFLGDRLYAMRAPDGAMALVEAGAPGVRVYRENRVVARSDAEGEALLTGLDPYAVNHLGVDPRDYPMDTDVAISSRVVVPPRGGGVVVNLAPAKRHSFVAIIRLANGEFPPVGTPVDIRNGSSLLMVGRSGEVFLGGATSPLDAKIETQGGTCFVHIVPPPPAPVPIMRAGPFVCRGETLHAP